MKESMGEPRRDADSRSNVMPLELQLDLLVDEELPEDRRRAVLVELDRDLSREGWRNLSLRFLERQVERRSVRDLIAGGRLLPVEEVPANYKMPGGGWRWRGVASVAAGLFIAAGSALVTGTWIQQHRATNANAGNSVEVAKSNLPGPAVGTHDVTPALQYRGVPKGLFMDGMLSPQQNGDRNAVVIQPDEPGKAMIIPVNTMQVY